MPHLSEVDHWNLERHLASDRRFTRQAVSVGGPYYDFHDPETGERQPDLYLPDALRLKNELDEAAERPRQ